MYNIDASAFAKKCGSESVRFPFAAELFVCATRAKMPCGATASAAHVLVSKHVDAFAPVWCAYGHSHRRGGVSVWMGASECSVPTACVTTRSLTHAFSSQSCRNFGPMMFVVLRDASGTVQVVLNSEDAGPWPVIREASRRCV